MKFNRDDFSFSLPPALVAQRPARRRDGARLLNADEGKIFSVRNFHKKIHPADVVVFNDSRVLPARLIGRKKTGGRVELLLERITGERELTAQIGARRPPAPEEVIVFGTGKNSSARVKSRRGRFFTLETDGAARAFVRRFGAAPLPPYIRRPADRRDARRYQTVFAKDDGSVAAPTAGLHFTATMLRALEDKGAAVRFVTLHVGAGTFLPVKDVNAPSLHAERFAVPRATAESINKAKKRGGRVVAVGTTVLRALESAAGDDGVRAYEGETTIFIKPGHHFRSADCLLTNFHQPESSLFMLVCAFGGFEKARAAYDFAVKKKMRFHSYGDAMFLSRTDGHLGGKDK